MINIQELIPHIEVLIFASDKPLTTLEITELINNAFGFMDEKVELDQIESSLEGIVEKYNSDFYPFEVRQSGGGWQFLTKRDYHKTVAQLNGEKFMKKLSAAAMETLSIIAYKQPITKGEMEAIRGVSCDYTVQKLLEKELVIITGRNEKMPGHPLVYATSSSFMDYFGINAADDLPKIKEVLAEQLIEPNIINHTPTEIAAIEEQDVLSEELEIETTNAKLVVAENGELLEDLSDNTEEESTDDNNHEEDNSSENKPEEDNIEDKE